MGLIVAARVYRSFVSPLQGVAWKEPHGIDCELRGNLPSTRGGWLGGTLRRNGVFMLLAQIRGIIIVGSCGKVNFDPTLPTPPALNGLV